MTEQKKKIDVEKHLIKLTANVFNALAMLLKLMQNEIAELKKAEAKCFHFGPGPKKATKNVKRTLKKPAKSVRSKMEKKV